MIINVSLCHRLASPCCHTPKSIYRRTPGWLEVSVTSHNPCHACLCVFRWRLAGDCAFFSHWQLWLAHVTTQHHSTAGKCQWQQLRHSPSLESTAATARHWQIHWTFQSTRDICQSWSLTVQPCKSSWFCRWVVIWSAKDTASCYNCSMVWLSVTTVNPTKTAEPIKMPFGLWTQVGPKNKEQFGGGPEHPSGGAILGFSYLLKSIVIVRSARMAMYTICIIYILTKSTCPWQYAGVVY